MRFFSRGDKGNYDPANDPLLIEAQEHAERISELIKVVRDERHDHPLGDMVRGTIFEGPRVNKHGSDQKHYIVYR